MGQNIWKKSKKVLDLAVAIFRHRGNLQNVWWVQEAFFCLLQQLFKCAVSQVAQHYDFLTENEIESNFDFIFSSLQACLELKLLLGKTDRIRQIFGLTY